MFTFLITIFALISFSLFTPESLVTTIGGFIVATVGTQWLKNATGVAGMGAFVLAVAISFGVAIVALVIATLLSGGGFSWDFLIQSWLQIFALSTMAYKALLAEPK